MRLGRYISSCLKKLEKNVFMASYSGEGITADFLIATKNGLYHLYQEKLYKLINGEFYGLTQRNGSWYVFQKKTHYGSILEFRLERGLIAGKRNVIDHLSVGCHQIDFVNDRLYITDTYNNRLISYSSHLGSFRKNAEHFPAGKLENGRNSDNYAHLNSITKTSEGLFLLFHNETTKTGKHSEIVRLGKNLDIVARYKTTAGNAHNLMPWKNNFLFCDSANSALNHGTKIVFSADMFTRGLACDGDSIILGGSAYGDRDSRHRLNGKIYILDSTFNKVFEFPVPGMVQETRISGKQDLGMCNNSTRYRERRLYSHT